MSAHAIAIVRFEQEWTPLGDSGAAVMPTGGLHPIARRKRWEWATDEITDGLAARAEDVAAVGAEPVPAYVLGHDVGPTGPTGRRPSSSGTSCGAWTTGGCGGTARCPWGASGRPPSSTFRSAISGSSWSASVSSCPRRHTASGRRVRSTGSVPP
ncbi:hypothetical protein ACWD9K_14465 [Streptomyces sp. 900116325]